MMVVFGFLAIATVAIITGSSQTSTDEYLSQQALHVANAGVSYTAKKLSSIPNWSGETGFTMTFGAGSFTISYLSKTATTATIRSDGAVGGITRSIEQQLTKGSGQATAFQNAIYANQNIVAEGSSSGSITGPVSAGGSLSNSSDVQFPDDVRQNDSGVQIPEPDWSYWQNAADSVINNNYTFDAGTYNGIYFIDGNVNFSGNVTLNGTLISTGSVSFTGSTNINITATQPNPAIIAMGNVTFAGTSDVSIQGFIVTLGDLTMTGSSDVDVNGGMIAGGDITFSGNTESEVVYTPVQGTVPGFTGGEGNQPIIFNQWREVY